MDHHGQHAISPHDVTLPAERLARALEGEHRWGYVDSAPAEHKVWAHKRLTVFPPGITAAQRRLLKRHRDWPIAGAVVTMFLMLALGEVMSPLPATTVAVALYVGSVALSAHLTHDLRARSRRIEATCTPTEGGTSSRGDLALLESAAAELENLEGRLDRGSISPAEFEAAWARVYYRLPGRDDVTTR